MALAESIKPVKSEKEKSKLNKKTPPDPGAFERDGDFKASI